MGEGMDMKPLECGKCTTCCRWGSDMAIRPILDNTELGLECEYDKGQFVLKAKPNGNCVYLGKGGCTIYEDRPKQCRAFDCRVLYKQMREKTFIKVILMGQRKSKL